TTDPLLGQPAISPLFTLASGWAILTVGKLKLHSLPTDIQLLADPLPASERRFQPGMLARAYPVTFLSCVGIRVKRCWVPSTDCNSPVLREVSCGKRNVRSSQER